MSKWPTVPLGDVLTKSDDWISLRPDESYQEVTVRLWGNGVTLRRSVTGSEIAASQRLRVHPRQFIISRIDARNGASGLIPASLDGAVVSSDFPVFIPNKSRLLPEYLGWFSKTKAFIALSNAASEGTTNRVRLKEARFLAQTIPLPPLAEQRRIIDKIDAIAIKLAESSAAHEASDRQANFLLLSAYHQIADDAPRWKFGDVAPLVRRPAMVDPTLEYPGVSVRSFGRGTFHNPPLPGSEITWEKPQLVKAGDILVSNIKAWEGAIAVAEPDDDSRFGSHRYLTFVPKTGAATSRFLCFHLLTPEGLYHVGEASPGSADRNRTLGTKAMLEIPVPVPAYNKQIWFDELLAKMTETRLIRQASAKVRDTMLPAILHKAFHGAL